MSKIYEALLQAEMDRAAADLRKSNGSGTPSAAPEQEVLASLREEPGRLPSAPVQEMRASRAALMEEAPAEHGWTPRNGSAAGASGQAGGDWNAAEVNPARIASTVWHPSLRQLPALQERGSAVEQFRSLRSRMHEFRDLNKLKSLLVSSGLPQEGKSFIAANLAISFARHKAARVLLIDGDMRRSSLHKMLGCPSEPGLTEYLSGKATIQEIMQRAKTGDDGPVPQGLASLTFIAGGADAENAADLSGNSRFGELIKMVSPMFDWIVVDTSPVNLVADGVNLARACDGVLLIARGGTTKFTTAQRALSELKASKILGFVLNAVHNPPDTGGYYGYDHYDKVNE